MGGIFFLEFGALTLCAAWFLGALLERRPRRALLPGLGALAVLLAVMFGWLPAEPLPYVLIGLLVICLVAACTYWIAAALGRRR